MKQEVIGSNEAAGNCGPGCRCGAGGVGSRMKWFVCGVVAVAAVVVVAAHVSRTQAANSQPKQDYATAIPVVAATDTAKPPPATDANTWGSPLAGLAELNVVATNSDAVFVVLPSNDAARTAAVQKEVTAAVATLAARGLRMKTFLLSKDTQEYSALVRQIGTPAVLAAYRGRGMAVVKDTEVTQDGLLKAFVASSRPSGCGPSGCAPGSAGCN